MKITTSERILVEQSKERKVFVSINTPSVKECKEIQKQKKLAEINAKKKELAKIEDEVIDSDIINKTIDNINSQLLTGKVMVTIELFCNEKNTVQHQRFLKEVLCRHYKARGYNVPLCSNYCFIVTTKKDNFLIKLCRFFESLWYTIT